MLNRRKILLSLSIGLVVGSLGATAAYAMHLRGRGLRDRTAAVLGARMRLEVDIGGVEPLSFASRRFKDIDLWLPQRRAQVGRCGSATWYAREGDGEGQHALHISDGWLLVGSRGWATDDYRLLLRSGFAHDFAALGIAEINVQRIDFRWSHPLFTLVAPSADGVIYFDDQGRGRAVLTVNKLNDTPVDEPIHVAASFTPGERMSFQKVEIRMGKIPIEALALDTLAGGPVSQGTFVGQITYRENRPARWDIEVSGAMNGARLEHLTRRVIGGPFTGQVDVSIEEAGFAQGAHGQPALESLRFRGRLEALQLGELAAALHVPELNGQVDLVVEQADFQNPDLKYLRLSGRAADVSLNALTRLLGYGVITGRLEMRINALAIVENEVQWADVDLIAMPPENAPAYIEKSALARVGREVFGMDLEGLLPERVEYSRMGVKLLLDREGLRVRGTHGEGNRTILTVKLLGREVGILKQPEKVYPVADLVALVRTNLRSYDVDDLVGWWTHRASPATTSPASEEP